VADNSTISGVCTSGLSTVALELQVRRRALDNMGAILEDLARSSQGRFTVMRLGDDAFGFRLADVRTLVRVDGALSIAQRSFFLLVGVPARWPMDRNDALEPCVVSPADWAHPNASGSALCLPLQGVMPEELPGLLYACVSLRKTQLDDYLDRSAAAWVRAHLDQLPTDPRPLFPEIPVREIPVREIP